MARLGWRFKSGMVLIDDRGDTVILTKTTPAILTDLIKAAAKRELERAVVRQMALRNGSFIGKRACCDLAWLAVNHPPKTMTPLQVGCFRPCVAGSAMTMSKAVGWGYDVANVCPLCGEAGDTIHHRTFGCRCTREEVEKVVPKWFMEEAVQAQTSDAF